MNLDLNNGTSSLSNISISQRPLTHLVELELMFLTVWFVQAMLNLTGGLFITATILYHRALRAEKTFVLYAGQFSLNTWIALGLSLFSAHRMKLLLTDEYLEPTTKLACAVQPATFIYNWSISQLLFWNVLSIDRLLLVTVPLWHHRLTTRSSWIVIIIFYVVGLINASVNLSLAASTPDQSAIKLCMNAGSVHPLVFSKMLIIYLVLPLSSVLIFILVLFVYVARKICCKPGQNVDLQRSESSATIQIWTVLSTERKFLISNGLMCLSTFLLFCLPATLLFVYLKDLNGQAQNMMYTLLFGTCINTVFLLKLSFLLKSHWEFRVGMGAMFRRKTLPPTLRLWQR